MFTVYDPPVLLLQGTCNSGRPAVIGSPRCLLSMIHPSCCHREHVTQGNVDRYAVYVHVYRRTRPRINMVFMWSNIPLSGQTLTFFILSRAAHFFRWRSETLAWCERCRHRSTTTSWRSTRKSHLPGEWDGSGDDVRMTMVMIIMILTHDNLDINTRFLCMLVYRVITLWSRPPGGWRLDTFACTNDWFTNDWQGFNLRISTQESARLLFYIPR